MLDQQEASMSAMFDFDTIRDVIAYPIRLIFGEGETVYVERQCTRRRPLVMRWRRGEDGKLESHWECGD